MSSRYPAGLTVQEKLNMELARRAPNAAIIFGLMAFVTFIFGVGTRWATGPLVMINITRYVSGKKLASLKKYSNSLSIILKSSILLNTLLWNFVTLPIIYETNVNGPLALTVLTMLASFTVGSSTSLSSIKPIAMLVQYGFLVPAMILITFMAQEQNSQILYMHVLLMGICLIYSLKQNTWAYNDIQLAIDYEDSLMKSNKDLQNSQADLLKSNEELKVSQEKLAAETSKLVHTSRMASLGEMAGGIAHEVNNPLFIMQGHVEHLRRLSTKVTDEDLAIKITDRAEKIFTTIQRIAQIIRGLRQFSQQSDALPMELISMQKIIQDTMDFCQEKLKVNGIVVKTNLQDDVLVNCRAVQISQVIINLVNNSYDAIQNLNEKWIEFSLKKEAGFIVFRLRDSGSGLPQTVQAKLFQPFFTTKEVGKGTGLGLSISTGIIKEHGGEISYDPLDSNTCFVIRLPIAAEIAARSSNAA